MSEWKQEVRQMTATLPYFNYDVPVLYLRDGTPYIPVSVLCHMLGLRANAYIPQWRKLLLWSNARKLPLQTTTRGRRLVWCLHFGALPLWFCCFDWKCVSPGRRAQLRRASSELSAWPDRLHQEMLTHYRQLRRFLFWFLTTYADADLFLHQLLRQWRPTFTQDDHLWLEELVMQGRALINEGAAIARKMLQEQGNLSIVETYHSDHYGNILGTSSLPLLPIVSSEDEEAFFDCCTTLGEWHHDMHLFLRERTSYDKEDN